jgi:hypothetical protein
MSVSVSVRARVRVHALVKGITIRVGIEDRVRVRA